MGAAGLSALQLPYAVMSLCRCLRSLMPTADEWPFGTSLEGVEGAAASPHHARAAAAGHELQHAYNSSSSRRSSAKLASGPGAAAAVQAAVHSSQAPARKCS